MFYSTVFDFIRKNIKNIFFQVYPKYVIRDKHTFPSYRAAVQEIEAQNKQIQSQVKASDQLYTFPETLQQQIFECISEQSEFMVEQQFCDIISKMEKHRGELIKLETIFDALGITKTEHIDILIKSFTPYLVCEICNSSRFRAYSIPQNYIPASAGLRDVSLTVLPLENSAPVTHLSIQKIDEIIHLSDEEHNAQVVEAEVQQEASLSFDSDELISVDSLHAYLDNAPIKDSQTELNLHNCHPHLLNRAYVLKALKHFVSRYVCN